MYFIEYLIITTCFQVSLISAHYEGKNNTRILNVKFSQPNTTQTYKPMELIDSSKISRYVDRYRFQKTSVQPKKNWRRIFRNVKFRKFTMPMRAQRSTMSDGINNFWTRSRRDGEAKKTRRTNPPIHKRQPYNSTGLSKYKRNTKPARIYRTMPYRSKFEENCDYLSHYCLKAYNTGVVCGRTIYVTYHTFTDYCMLDYVNCMERYEIWSIAHLGPCFNITNFTEPFYTIMDDYWLDRNVQPEVFLPW